MAKRKRRSSGDIAPAADSPEVADAPAPAPRSPLDNLGLGGLLNVSARVFVKHLRLIAIVGFGLYLPIEASVAVITPSNLVELKEQFEAMQVEVMFELLFGVIASMMVIRLTAHEIDGESTRLSDLWRAVRSRYFPSVATSIASQLVFWGLAIPMIVPAAVGSVVSTTPVRYALFSVAAVLVVLPLAGLVYMTFYLQAVVLRQESGFHPLKHSKRIVEGRFWHVAGYALFFTVSAEALPWIDQLAPTPWIAAPLGATISVLSLFFVVMGTVLYLHLDRTRFD